MKRLRLVPLMLAICLLLSFAAPSAFAVDPPHLKSADAALVIDMYSGAVLYELNSDQPHSIASLTKIMTCLLAVEAVERGDVSLTDMVEAPNDCLQGLDISSSNAGIQPGEVMSFQDLLYCALVHSANDACNVIAVHVAGSIASFVQRMNARAKELGCANTQFIDTDGMLNRSDGHYSTPYDLYLITKEALSHQLFAKLCSTADYTVSATNYRAAFDIHNSNALLTDNGLYGAGYLYSGVVGVKTGFTKPAGYCLVSACKRGSEYLMCIVMGCNGPLTYTVAAGEYQNFMDSATLYDWAFGHFSSRTIFLAGEPLKRVKVDKAKDDATVALCPNESLTLFIADDVGEEDIVVDIQPFEDRLVAPIEQGDVIGVCEVYVGGGKMATVSMVADASVELSNGLQFKENLRNFFTSKGLKIAVLSILLLALAFVVFRMYMKYQRRRQVRAKIAARNRRMYEARMNEQQVQQQRKQQRYAEYAEYSRSRQQDASAQRQAPSTRVQTVKREPMTQRQATVQTPEEKRRTPTPVQRVEINSSDFDFDAYINSLDKDR